MLMPSARRCGPSTKTPSSSSSTRRPECPKPPSRQPAGRSDAVALWCVPLDLFALKEVLSLALRARAKRRSKKPRIRFVPSRVPGNTNLGRSLSESLEKWARKSCPSRAAHRRRRIGGQRTHDDRIRTELPRSRRILRVGPCRRQNPPPLIIPAIFFAPARTRPGPPAIFANAVFRPQSVANR